MPWNCSPFLFDVFRYISEQLFRHFLFAGISSDYFPKSLSSLKSYTLVDVPVRNIKLCLRCQFPVSYFSLVCHWRKGLRAVLVRKVDL